MDLLEHEASIVLIGSLNPVIFHPEWLSKLELISPRDLDGADIKIVHPEITQFKLPWSTLEVQQNRFIVRTNDPAYFLMLRDLAIGIFTFLEHTPITAMGINSIVRYRADNVAAWHRIGDALVPKTIWRNFLHGHVGMTKVSVNSELADGLSGNKNISISPIMDNHSNGIIVDINNHFPITDTVNISKILQEQWEKLQTEATRLSEGILNEASAQ